MVQVANDKALRDLEFDRLKSVVRGYATSSLGEEAVDELVPITDEAAIGASFAEVEEAVAFLGVSGRFSLGGVRDLAPLLDRARQGSGLSGEEFLAVLQTLDATLDLRRHLTQPDGPPRLRAHAERLAAGGDAMGLRIRQAIDERGEVRDDASPELTELLRKRRTVEGRVETKLRGLIERSPEIVSEPSITRRRGRLVVPVKSGAISMSDYVVQDRSATGQTLYAEPTWLVPENNMLAELADGIRDEVRRILRELTEAFLGSEAALLRDRAVLAHLDGLFARAGFAVAYRCVSPRIGPRLALHDARHPLLGRERAVPITLSLGSDRRMTVITGPNTGGKTVTLKTLGLLTLMAQSGIPIPAAPDSEVRVMAKVRTDIGDEQSIAQNLSTFSAHMKNIVAILADADGEALVLLDELGAGTDPQEGAALGLSIVEALLGSGALVAVSTHLTPLKYFAIRHPEIKTASMEFDLVTLSPTFRVIEGVPGRSNAFIIAERLGLPADLINRAREVLSAGEIRAEDIIDELHRERRVLVEQREAAERDRRAARETREMYESRLGEFERDKEQALSERARSLEAFLRDGQKRAEEALARLRGEEVQAAEDAKAQLREIVALRAAVAETREAIEEAIRPAPLPAGMIDVGQLVHVRSVDSSGRIVHVDSRGKVVVDLDGGIHVSTGASDLEMPRPAKRTDSQRERSTTMRRPRPSQVPLQLDLRGMTVSEALRHVETYLDDVLRADLRNARILHGKGTGALRDAVRAYLASCSFVTSYKFAAPNLGGDGVTEIELGSESPTD
jgi:DNA mismatch repair protein MutS2